MMFKLFHLSNGITCIIHRLWQIINTGTIHTDPTQRLTKQIIHLLQKVGEKQVCSQFEVKNSN